MTRNNSGRQHSNRSINAKAMSPKWQRSNGKQELSIQGDAVSGDKKTVHDGDWLKATSMSSLSLSQFPRSPAPTPRRLHRTHRRTPRTRAAIAEVRAIWGLYGQGGVGKTALALKTGRELSRYPTPKFTSTQRSAKNPSPPRACPTSSALPSEAKFPEKEEISAPSISPPPNKPPCC